MNFGNAVLLIFFFQMLQISVSFSARQKVFFVPKRHVGLRKGFFYHHFATQKVLANSSR